MEEAKSARLYILQQTGPTSFVIKEEASDTKYKIQIGDQHKCSCTAKSKPCVHIVINFCNFINLQLFIMQKYFRLVPENPLLWQQGLVDSEITTIIQGRNNASSKTWLQLLDTATAR